MPISIYAYPHQFCGQKFVDMIYQGKKVLSHQFYFQSLYRALGSKGLDTKAARPRGLSQAVLWTPHQPGEAELGSGGCVLHI